LAGDLCETLTCNLNKLCGCSSLKEELSSWLSALRALKFLAGAKSLKIAA
jgi:hypothetical protein